MHEAEARFVGLDLHRHDVMVRAVNAHQDIVLTPQRVTLRRFAAWVSRHLRPTDQVAIEAITNTWMLYDLLEPHVARVVVAHPQHVRWIGSGKVKHDKRDALVLAHLLSANLLPEVWVLPPPVRQLRSLIVHRHHLAAWLRTGCGGCCFASTCPPQPVMSDRLTIARGGRRFL
jgi:transposase